MRTLLPTLAAALATLLALAPATATAAPTVASLSRQVATLKAQNARLVLANSRLSAQVKTRNGTITTHEATIATRDATIAALNTQVANAQQLLVAATGAAETASARIQQLTIDRDNALAGLPNAILAVPRADFPRLVFTPARQAWPCDSYYQSEGYWSYTFDGGAFC